MYIRMSDTPPIQKRERESEKECVRVPWDGRIGDDGERCGV